MATPLNFPDPAVEQEYSSDDVPNVMWTWDGEKWTSKVEGGGSSNVSGPKLPPLVELSGPALNLSNSDGKTQYSLDGDTYSSSLTVPSETIYYVDWTDDIDSAAHGSDYQAAYTETYPNLGVVETIDLELKIDKLPDPFTFTPLVDVTSETEYTSNTISPLESINAPTSVWGSSDALTSYVSIGDGSWVAIPSAPNSLYINRDDRLRVKHKTGPEPTTAYVTTLNIGYGTGAGEFETSSFSTTTFDQVVNQPTITAPSAGDTVDASLLLVTASAFEAQNVGAHKSSHWQIARDTAFTDIVVESDTTVDLESWTPFPETPESGTMYVRVKYTGTLNDVESAWSETVQFTTQELYFWRVTADLKGGGGGGGYGGGYAQIELVQLTRMQTPAGDFSGVLGQEGGYSTSSGPASGGAGWAAGGDCPNCVDSMEGGYGGAGGGSSIVRFSGTNLAICGGAGGTSMQAAAGVGGNPGEKGGNGAILPETSGGAGGEPGFSQGVGGGSSCGWHYNGDIGASRSYPGGAGGGGGNGGGAGTGNTQNTWYSGSGGGGGGGAWNGSDINGWTNNGWTALTRESGDGKFVCKLFKANYSSPGDWVELKSYTKEYSAADSGAFSVTISDLK